MRQRARQIAFFLATIWVVISPYIWRSNITHRFNVDIPLELFIQPILLSVTALFAVPVFIIGNRKAAVTLAITSLLIAGSLFFVVSAFSGGVVFNALLLTTLSVLTFRSSGSSKAALLPPVESKLKN